MTAPILVTGGTGTLGRQVVPRLRDALAAKGAGAAGDQDGCCHGASLSHPSRVGGHVPDTWQHEDVTDGRA